MKVKELIELIESFGYVHVRTRGDHRIFKKDGCRPIPIPGKLSDDVPIGTQKAILRQIAKVE